MSQKQESKQFPGQHDDEEIAFLFRQHPLVMRKFLIFGLLVILVAILPLDFPQVYSSDSMTHFFVRVALFVPIAVLIVWVYRWIGWYYTVWLVTDERIIGIKQRGLFDRRVEEWQLDSIQNVNYHIDGFQAVIFGYGDITAKAYTGDLEMKKIHKPAEVHEKLLAAVRASGGGSTRANMVGSTRSSN
jgi:uncharacterized membrane protein YdbT with pleckstrin-like domain